MCCQICQISSVRGFYLLDWILYPTHPINPDAGAEMWKVVYEDGDGEELDREELHEGTSKYQSQSQ